MGCAFGKAQRLLALEKADLVPYKGCTSVPALKITNLRKVYRRGTVAGDDLSLTIPEGEFFGVLDPDGAGISPASHCVAGIAEPSEGTIEIFGLDAVKYYREARRLV